jgi:hypothetical protein
MATRRSPASLGSTRRGVRAGQRRPGQSSHAVLHLDACPWPAAPRQARRRDGIPAFAPRLGGSGLFADSAAAR